MARVRFQEIFVHPAFVAFFLWIILIILIPGPFKKYKIIQITDDLSSENTFLFYSDLDNDGYSEKISVDLSDAGQTKILIYKEDLIVEQYNIRHHPPGKAGILTNDMDNDNNSELFVFTVNGDSIYLNIIDPLKNKKILLTGRFIDLRNRNVATDEIPEAIPLGLINVPGKGTRDLLFRINTGFSKHPRNVYRYDIENDSLFKSPLSGATITGCIIHDLGDDGIPEIIPQTDATGNLDEDFPFSDQYTWLMVLNCNLEFIFQPFRLGRYPSRLRTIPVETIGGPGLVVFNDHFGTDTAGSSLGLYNLNGKKLRELIINDYERLHSEIFVNHDKERATFFFLKNRTTLVEELDHNLIPVTTFNIPPVGSVKPLAVFDADGDGRNEYIFSGLEYGSLVITRDNFRNPVEFSFRRGSVDALITPVLRGNASPLICADYNGYTGYIQYGKNPLFYFKYPFYASIYLALLLMLTLIYRLQKYRADLKLKTERQIADLQLKAIRNQIDPHFTMNVLNSIGGLYATEKDRQKADYLFGKYARLIRQTVISSDRIIVTIAEEIEFVRDYLDIERLRFNDSFSYEIDINDDVEKHAYIPRMLIHTFAENAVKYGIRKRPAGGLIRISLQNQDGKCLIIIEDNGHGLGDRFSCPEGTGRGLRIVDEMTDLYYRLEKKQINWTLENITGPGNIILGARAIIELD